MTSVAQRPTKSASGLKKSASSKAPQPPAQPPMPSLYEILQHRIVDFAQNLEISQKPPKPADADALIEAAKSERRKQPRKLEMRLGTSKPDEVSFSAPFLDNTLSKMLALQNRMLTLGNNMAKNGDLDEATQKEQFAQSAELSRIIALICAEKARQGA